MTPGCAGRGACIRRLARGRAGAHVANELQGLMTAASQRLGKEGTLNASRSATGSRRIELPGSGREHQAGLDKLARTFVQAREGMTLSKD